MKATFALVCLLIVLGLALASPSAPGAKCSSNKQCRLQVCKLGRCGPLGGRDELCDEDADCYGEQVCSGNKCTRCPGETDCSAIGSSTEICVDAQTDLENCGTCGNVCDDDEACVKGVCKIPACQTYTADELFNCLSDGDCPDGLDESTAYDVSIKCHPPRPCNQLYEDYNAFEDCCYDEECYGTLSRIIACNTIYVCD